MCIIGCMETDELGIRQARQGFGALVNRTATRDRITFITSHGRRVAAVVPLRIAEAAVAADTPGGRDD